MVVVVDGSAEVDDAPSEPPHAATSTTRQTTADSTEGGRDLSGRRRRVMGMTAPLDR
jgi:hypothetical protein